MIFCYTLIRTTRTGLSTACARCQWVEATSRRQLVTVSIQHGHPAGDHWSSDWSVARYAEGLHSKDRQTFWTSAFPRFSLRWFNKRSWQ